MKTYLIASLKPVTEPVPGSERGRRRESREAVGAPRSLSHSHSLFLPPNHYHRSRHYLSLSLSRLTTCTNQPSSPITTTVSILSLSLSRPTTNTTYLAGPTVHTNPPGRGRGLLLLLFRQWLHLSAPFS